MSRFRASAKITQHGTGFDGGKLVLVTQQNQPSVVGQGGEHGGHHFQIDHRRFVDDQHVQVQRVAAVMAEVTRIGPRAEQAMQGIDLTGNGCTHVIVDIELRDLRADRRLQPGGGLASGGGKADTQGTWRVVSLQRL